MKKTISILSILFCFVLTTSFNTNKITWKLEKNKNSIRVFSYTPENESLKRVKTIFKVKAKLSTVVAVLSDVPHYTDWIYNCSEAKLLKKVNNREMFYYSVSDVPWPLSNRDLVMKNKIHQNRKTKIVYSISVPQFNLLPKRSNRVRIVKMYGQWKITPLKNGFVAIEYYLSLDPGGNVPDWVTNLTIQIGPYQSMLKFKEMLKIKRYQEAKFDFIHEI